MTKELLPVTSLRFFAAFYVFLFHFDIGQPLASKVPALSHALSLGAVGMSLFFVLSGFVLSLSYRDAGEPGFTARYAFYRFTRIYPVYFVAALCTIPLLLTSMGKAAGTDTQTLLRYAFLIFTNLMLLQAWFPQFFQHWNDGGSWSISTEAFFYAIFPLVIKPIRQMSGRGILGALAFLYVCTSLPGLSWDLFAKEFSFSVFYATPIYRVSEFLIGVLAGTWFARGNKVVSPSIFFLWTAAALACYLMYGPTFGFIFVADNWFVVPCIAMLLWCAASMESGPLYRALSNRVLVYLGHISYSFYSFQVLVFFFLYKYLDKVKAIHPVFHHHWAVMILTFVGVLACSVVSFHVLEKTLREAMNGWYRKQTQPFARCTSAASSSAVSA